MRKKVERFVLASEIAPRFGLTREQVIRRIQTRDLPGEKVPGLGWAVDVTSLDEELEPDPAGRAA